eukprot:441352_1
MSTAVNLLQPNQWMPICIIGLVVLIINGCILIKEIKRRNHKTVKFETKYFKIWSVLCIISGVLFGFFAFVQHIDGFCHFAQHLLYIIIGFQGIFMGFYQLSKLHRLFAQSQEYNTNGYPTCLFFFMYTIGIVVLISAIICPWFFLQLPITCGINKQYQYDDISKIPASTNISFAAKIIGLISIVAFLWDLTTLALYIIKLLSFQNIESNQRTRDGYNRILCGLNRIIILTVLYEITSIICISVTSICGQFGWSSIIGILYNISGGLASIAMNYSMFLMQQHNNDQYDKFLKLLYVLRLHYIGCCCFKSIIIDSQVSKSNSNKTEDTNIKSVNYSKVNIDNTHNSYHDTIFETRDNTIKMEHSKPDMLSIDTTMWSRQQKAISE